MSSHREAPEISKDPVADNTDTYAFISPDAPGTVTIIANFIPLQKPDGGPNFYEFGDNVVYEINISNKGKAGEADITYRFEFDTFIRNRNTFLYNTGPITSIGSTAWNRPQTYRVTRVHHGHEEVLGHGLPVPPVNVGPRSTPNYAALAASAVVQRNGRKFFCGQRADAFHVDLGSVFDLGGLRPLNQAHLIPLATMDGVNSVQSFNVHTIAMQVPISDLTRHWSHPTDPMQPDAVIGVWASASRQMSQVWNHRHRRYTGHGPWNQVSRLGNPLFNEVIVAMADKDEWNHRDPSGDGRYAQRVLHPELQALLPVLYPMAFPNLKGYTKDRADLAAILLTGIPSGVVPGFQNYTGSNQADMLRLNVAIPASAKPNNLGLVAADPAGFPNGRRIDDDVVTIELRAVAGLTIPLVDPNYKPDAAVSQVADGTTNTNGAELGTFPYLGTPLSGYDWKPGARAAS